MRLNKYEKFMSHYMSPIGDGEVCKGNCNIHEELCRLCKTYLRRAGKELKAFVEANK